MVMMVVMFSCSWGQRQRWRRKEQSRGGWRFSFSEKTWKIMMGWQLWIWIKSFRKKKKHVTVFYRQTVSLRRETGDCWICESHIVRVNTVSSLSHQIQTRVMSNISLLFIFFSPWTNKFTWNLTRSKKVWGKLLVVDTNLDPCFLSFEQTTPISVFTIDSNTCSG